MIPVSAAAIAISAAQEFDRAGYILVANQGSLLGELINSTSPFSPKNNVQYDPVPEYISGASNGFADIEEARKDNAHEIYMRQSAKEIARHVASHLNFARNTVRPLIQHVVEELTKDFQDIPTTLQPAPKIVVIDLPAPMKDSSLEASIGAFKEKARFNTNVYAGFPALCAAEIMDYIVTGRGGLDDVVRAWAASVGDKLIERAWSAAYSGSEETITEAFGDIDDGVNIALVIYLASERLINNPPDGINMSLGEYNALINELRTQSALRLVAAYRAEDNALKSKALIRLNSGNTIYVNATVYADWKEQGGNDIVLYGNSLRKNFYRTADELSANADTLMREWERYCAMKKSSDIVERSGAYSQAVKRRGFIFIREHMQECFGYLKEGGIVDENIAEYQLARKKIEDFCLTLKWSDFENIWSLAKRMVCECVFWQHAAGEILDEFEKACKDNENISGRDAALLATIAYVSSYAADQVGIVKFLKSVI